MDNCYDVSSPRYATNSMTKLALLFWFGVIIIIGMTFCGKKWLMKFVKLSDCAKLYLKNWHLYVYVFRIGSTSRDIN
jgi:hypothetical protein